MSNAAKYILKKLLFNPFFIPIILLTIISRLVTQLGLTYFLKQTLESIAKNSNIFTPFYIFVGLSVFALINTILWCLIASIYIFPKFDELIGKELFANILKRDYIYHRQHNSAKLVEGFKTLYRESSHIVGMLTVFTAPTILTMIITPIYLYYINLKYMYCAILLIILYWMIIIFFLPKTNAIDSKFNRNALDDSKSAGEIINNINTMILYGAQNHEIDNAGKMLANARKLLAQLEASYGLMYSLIHLLIITCTSIIIYLCLQDIRINLTIVDFSTIINLFAQFQFDLMICAWIVCDVAKKFTRLNEAYKLIFNDNAQRKSNKFGEMPLDKIGDIVFENITFGYNNNDMLFNNLSFTINQGAKVGIVGYSGGGKTSLVNLIYGLYVPQSGKILIDDKDLHDIKESDYRAKVSSIIQNAQIFEERTIFENIQYNANKQLAEVIKAANLAGAAEFIDKMQDKYNAKAFGLSGGQKQRIAIARAILHDGELIIMDEATSAIDVITEKHIQDNLELIFKGKTAIVIAHRLSTLRNMNEIIVMDRGQIVQRDSHTNLMKDENGIYYKLVQTQINGYILDR